MNSFTVILTVSHKLTKCVCEVLIVDYYMWTITKGSSDQANKVKVESSLHASQQEIHTHIRFIPPERHCSF